MDESDKKATTCTCISSIKIKFKKTSIFWIIYLYKSRKTSHIQIYVRVCKL